LSANLAPGAYIIANYPNPMAKDIALRHRGLERGRRLDQIGEVVGAAMDHPQELLEIPEKGFQIPRRF
jgi:hypothetical protein